MKIAFIKPCWPYPYSKGDDTYNRIWPPLCLTNCAAILERKGHAVEIIDAHALRIKPDRLAGYIKGYNKIFITSSTLDKWQCPNIDISPFLEAVRRVVRFSAEVYVMGYHGTVDPESILNITGAKAVIRGEPEDTVADICQNSDLFKVKGISFMKEGEFISNPDRELIDLKTLPLPAYHLLDAKKYFYEILGKNFALFEISRGCQYGCKFCNKIMYGEKVRFKHIKQIIEEIKVAIERYNIKTGYFIDLEFLLNKEIVSLICEFLIEKKYDFKWSCQVRVDSLDAEILKKMKDAGCELIHFGIESGLQKFLDYLDKGIRVEKMRPAITMCKRLGIKTLTFLLFGFPKETREDREESFSFIRELNADFASFHRVFPYKGSAMCQNNLAPQGEVSRFMRHAYFKYYLRPGHLFRLDRNLSLNILRLFLGRIKTL